MKIAIVGGGPKGMYGFERLAAHFAAHPPIEPVEIHIFNRTAHFGSGDIYRPDQPDYLLINYALGNINAWIDECPSAVVPYPRSFSEWLCEVKGLHINQCNYTSRAQVGEYLEDCFWAIAENLPANVSGKYVVGEVVDLREASNAYQLTVRHITNVPAAELAEDKVGLASSDDIELPYQHVLLTTGHPRTRTRATRHDIPFIYPVKPTLTELPPNQVVAVKGMGLTFVDAVLALTEGRGGQFARTLYGLRYERSGNEPSAIYPYSRSGLPILPRPPHVGASPLKLHYLTRENLGRKPHNFQQTLWPLLRQEMIHAYYRTLLQRYDIDLDDYPTFAAVQEVIDAFHRESWTVARFNPERFLNPLKDTPPLTPLARHQLVVNYWRRAVQSAQADEPNAAVIAVWRRALGVFQEAFAFGGLTPRSQRVFMEKYASPLNRVTFGPPIESVEKLIAVAETGILRFDYSDGLYPDFDVHIDARIPKVSLRATDSPLYQNILRRGIGRLFTNTNGTESYQPGCLACDEFGRLIDTNGNPTNITLYGTPTEGIVFDNDSLSRHCNNFASAWATHIVQSLAE